MLKHHNANPDVGRGPHPASGTGRRRTAAASLAVIGCLSFFAFVALHRAPLPAEAFTALAVQVADKADMARTA